MIYTLSSIMNWLIMTNGGSQMSMYSEALSTIVGCCVTRMFTIDVIKLDRSSPISLITVSLRGVNSINFTTNLDIKLKII